MVKYSSKTLLNQSVDLKQGGILCGEIQNTIIVKLFETIFLKILHLK